jgi:hypothetical protein
MFRSKPEQANGLILKLEKKKKKMFRDEEVEGTFLVENGLLLMKR